MLRLRTGLPDPFPWLLVLWLAALILALIGLGNVPLRDWDEATVARVSLEMSRSPWLEELLPTYLGEPYVNKPPGLHLGIAAAFRIWEVVSGSGAGSLPPDWVVRLIPALGSSLLVPLLGLVQWRLRPGRRDVALATAVITLTLLPLARHGRLAMLDGTQLSAMALVWLGTLTAEGSTSRVFAGGLLAGLGGSVLLLLKAPVAIPVLATALTLRALDRDLRSQTWFWLLAGLLLGLVPGLAWHGWHLAARGPRALVMWGPQGAARLVRAVNDNAGGPLQPLTQVLVGGWPWLPLLPFGLARAWRERRGRAGRWTLALGVVAALMVFPLRTQLPWYSLVLWPPFALACGPVLVDLASRDRAERLAIRLGGLWAGLGALLLGLVALCLLMPQSAVPPNGLMVVLPAAGGLLWGGWWLARPDPLRPPGLAIRIVVFGWYLSLALLFASPLWNWELSEQPSIGPALDLAKRRPGELPIRLLDGDDQTRRPSLHWYLDSPAPPLDERGKRWPPQPFRLLTRADQKLPKAGARCKLEQSVEQGWNRWLCQAIKPEA